jgi:hypothetical protein
MMLKKSPRAAVQDFVRRQLFTSRPASARIRLRRRLYLFSAPVVAMLVLAAAKAILVGIVGNSAIPDFTRHDIEALRDDVSLLSIFDVIDPAKTSFVAGDLSVLEGRLQDADARFSDSFSRTDERQSCPVRVNLLLIRETLGDLATRAGDKQRAEGLYTAGLTLANDAPPACFAGNADPNPDRRAIREHSVLRLHQKLDILHRPPAAAPPPASMVVPPPLPTSLTQLTSAPPLPGLPESSTPSSTAPGQGPAPAPEPGPGPGPNMPEPPQTGTAPVPILGPDGDSNEGPEGPGPLNPVSPDRLPTGGGNGAAPGHRLGGGVPLDQLRKLLDNANAYGDNQE